MRWMLLALALVGCSIDDRPCRESYEGKAEVERTWENFLSTAGECPCVRWVTQERLDCTRWGSEPGDWMPALAGQGNGWIADTMIGRICVYGLSVLEEGSLEAITPGDLAHELVHHWLWRRGGGADPDHHQFVWEDGGLEHRVGSALAGLR